MNKEDFEKQFCLLPWIGLDVGISGHYRPCCKFETYYGASYHDSNIQAPKVNFHDGWKSYAAGDIRYQFASGKQPKECIRCWEEEKAGIKSMRQTEFTYDPLIDLRSPGQLAQISSPHILDLKLGSACNLKCRICDPYHSSLWFEEYENDQSMPREQWFKKFDSFMTEDNWKILREWLPNIRRLMIFGGEPFFQKDFYKILDLCIATDSAKHISLLVNTNTTIFDKRFVERFKNFEFIEIHHSIDDLKERFEYQRHSAKWDVVNNILENYANLKTTNTRMVLYCTISIFNIYYLPEYVKWAKEHFSDHSILFNLLHFPLRFSIVNLPLEVKQILQKRLNKLDLSDYNLLKNDNINSILEYMNGNRNDEEFTKGIKEIKRADTYRKENFSDTFPEMYELLKNYFCC